MRLDQVIPLKIMKIALERLVELETRKGWPFRKMGLFSYTNSHGGGHSSCNKEPCKRKNITSRRSPPPFGNQKGVTPQARFVPIIQWNHPETL